MLALKRFFLFSGLLVLPFQPGKHFWFPFSYVFGLPVDYLAPAFYLTDAFFLAALLFELLSFFDRREKRKASIFSFFQKNKWFLFLVAVNLFSAVNPTIAFFGWLKLLRMAFLAFLVYQEKIWVKKQLPFLISFWLGATALLAVAQFWQQESIGSFFWWLGEREFSLLTPGIAKVEFGGRLYLRPYASFSHPNSLAGFVLLSLCLFPFKNRKRLWSRLVLGLGLASLFLTFSRTAWLAGLTILILSKWSKFSFQGKFWFSLSLVFLAVLFFSLFPNPAAFQERINLIRVSLAIFKQKPWFGIGWDNFFLKLPELWPYERQAKVILQPVHNLFLLILSQAGVGGLVFFLWLLKKAIKQTTLAGWLIIFLTGMTDHYWLTLSQNIFLLGVFLGLSF